MPLSSVPPPSLPAAADARPPRRPGTFRALRHANYRLYFTGQIVSLTGSWVQTAAMTWLAYDLTGQSRWPALVSAAQVLPTLALGVWGGGLADRLPRRPLIFLSQFGLLALAVLLAGLAALHRATPTALLLVSLGIGVVNAIDTPARLAFVVDLVGRDDLINAVALNSLVFNVARAAGPALGGLLLPYVGAGGCFLFNGVTFVAILGALAAMQLPPAVPRPLARPDAGHLLDGFRHLARHRDLVLLIGLAGAMAFFGWPLLSLLPAVADQQLEAGNAGYSWMLSGIGVGALTGAAGGGLRYAGATATVPGARGGRRGGGGGRAGGGARAGGGGRLVRAVGVWADPVLRHRPGDAAARRRRAQPRADHGHLADGAVGLPAGRQPGVGAAGRPAGRHPGAAARRRRHHRRGAAGGAAGGAETTLAPGEHTGGKCVSTSTLSGRSASAPVWRGPSMRRPASAPGVFTGG
ncbi:MAG: MFS transporter [Gemmataceae bacterium]